MFPDGHYYYKIIFSDDSEFDVRDDCRFTTVQNLAKHEAEKRGVTIKTILLGFDKVMWPYGYEFIPSEAYNERGKEMPGELLVQSLQRGANSSNIYVAALSILAAKYIQQEQS